MQQLSRPNVTKLKCSNGNCFSKMACLLTISGPGWTPGLAAGIKPTLFNAETIRVTWASSPTQVILPSKRSVRVWASSWTSTCRRPCGTDGWRSSPTTASASPRASAASCWPRWTFRPSPGRSGTSLKRSWHDCFTKEGSNLRIQIAGLQLRDIFMLSKHNLECSALKITAQDLLDS